MNTQSVENYLKCIYSLSEKPGDLVATNAIAQKLDTKASSVTDMLKKLKQKDLVDYVPYKGVSLSLQGEKQAINVIRKHRLWEVFLLQTLKFGWDEVHDIAEQLEHIHSPELVNRLDAYLNYPEVDPHGDPVPDQDGVFRKREKNIPLFELKPGQVSGLCALGDSSSDFLKYLDHMGLYIGARIEMIEQFKFDQSVAVMVGDKKINLSRYAAGNLYVKQL